MPVRCQYFANNIPIPRQHTANYLPIHSQSIANSLPIESQCSSNPLSIHVNTNPHWCQYTANPVSVSCQFRSTHLQCSTNPANLPIWLSNAYLWPIRQSGTNLPINSIYPNPLPNQWQSRPNREPIRRQSCANPIICQSRSIQCQSNSAPASIWWPSGSIHCQSSSISVPILGHGSNTNPVSILDNPPIQCQSRTYLPIPGQSTNPMPILYQPTVRILIRGQFANSIPSCPSITDPPIQYQSTNPLPICQSITNMTIHYQSANLWQPLHTRMSPHQYLPILGQCIWQM